MSRSPILDYASANPVTPFYETVSQTKYLLTQDGKLFLTEAGFAIEIEE